jgi:hypothetical protein
MKFGSEKIEGQEIEIDVNGQGQFSADVGGVLLEASTVHGLREKARKQLRSMRSAVPATLLKYEWRDDPPKFVDVEIVGIHASNRNPLLRDMDGRSIRSMSYNSVLMRRLTNAERRKLTEAAKAEREAEKHHEDLKTSFRINPEEAIAEAQEKK